MNATSKWHWCSWLKVLGYLKDMECIVGGRQKTWKCRWSLIALPSTCPIHQLVWCCDSPHLMLKFWAPICEMFRGTEMIDSSTIWRPFFRALVVSWGLSIMVYHTYVPRIFYCFFKVVVCETSHKYTNLQCTILPPLYKNSIINHSYT